MGKVVIVDHCSMRLWWFPVYKIRSTSNMAPRSGDVLGSRDVDARPNFDD
jgi:hypothetical protein